MDKDLLFNLSPMQCLMKYKLNHLVEFNAILICFINIKGTSRGLRGVFLPLLINPLGHLKV